MACGSNKAWCLFLSVQFYWNTTIPVHICIVHSCFYVTTAVTETLWPKSPRMYSHAVFGKLLLTYVLGCWDHFETTLDYLSFHYLFPWANYKFTSIEVVHKKYLGLGQAKSQGTNARQLPSWLTVITTHWTHSSEEVWIHYLRPSPGFHLSAMSCNC